jgi:PAS domain S-box-containing protein
MKPSDHHQLSTSETPRDRNDSALHEFTSIILESISDGVFTVDSQWRITSFNRAAEEITGVSRREAIGRRCAEVFRASMCEHDCALRHTVDTGTPIVNRSAFIIDSGGQRVPVSVSTAMLLDPRGRMVGGVETFRDLSLVEHLRKELEGRFQLGDLISRSPAMREIFDMLPQVADSRSTVLIQGETGTGKELLAKAIHNLSPRRDQPFVAVNCGALPETLLESELFGYKAGAFTGAVRDKPGRFALARGGTLFLDEIGDIKMNLQVRLLRVLQEKTFEPLGGMRSEKADVRLLAATNRDLARAVDENLFRQDLYYRINVIRIDLPPLRSRKEDIPLLVAHFVARLNRIQGKAIDGVGPDVMPLLMDHDYPGNVRELENIIEHAFVLCREGSIQRQHLPSEFAVPKSACCTSSGHKAAMRSVERQSILDALAQNNNNRLATARQLGIHKTTLFRKMKTLDIPFAKADGRSGNR